MQTKENNIYIEKRSNENHAVRSNHAVRYYAKEIDPCTCFI